VPLYAATVASLGMAIGSYMPAPERAMMWLAPTSVVLFHDQTEEVDGNRAQQREGWSAGKSPPKSRFMRETARAQQQPADGQDPRNEPPH